MKRLIVKCSFPPGDIVLLTAAIRDLHACYPSQFSTDVRTNCPEIWQHNPNLAALRNGANGVKTIECSYPLINRSNFAPCHVINGFMEFLNGELGINMRPTAPYGAIYLSQEEKSWSSQVREIVGEDIPFWIVVAGGKHDVSVKWWETRRYQEIVVHFRGKIQFVQIGAREHHHPKLDGVIDLRGQTNLRQLIRLMYHAQGVVCPVTLAMHLAAAVEVKGGIPKNRPCVVVAGGREPAQWEAYPHHQYIHTNGALLCCDNGGCWKSRTVPLGDGDERDRQENLCVDVVRGETPLPRCMDMITSAEVIRRIEWYFTGGAVSYLTATQARSAERTVAAGERRKWDSGALDAYVFRRHSERFIKSTPRYPTGRFSGRGVVICAGGSKYFPCAWVAVKMLRQLGCELPVEFWHLGAAEISSEMKALVAPLGVECVDCHEVLKQFPARIVDGWPLKAYALLHSSFEEVLFLDADNTPVVNPEFLFGTPEYRKHGAIFWPDPVCMSKDRAIWEITGVRYRQEREFESGQIVVDKARCWKALNLAMHYNEHADFYYHHIYGDKDTFHFAFRKVGKTYAMPELNAQLLDGTMCQHDFEGRRIFQHRIKKWKLEGNTQTPGFLFEEDCIGYLEELRGLLAPKVVGNGVDGMRMVKEMNRKGIVPNPAPTTVELFQVKGSDPQMVKHREMLAAVAKRKFAYPADRFAGRGIVICGGGAKYFPCVYVLARMLRHLGCGLPVEVWHLGAKEMSPMMRRLLEPYGVRCVDGLGMRRAHPVRRLGGWELKCYAVMHSRFAEVLLLDADNCPVRDPAFLFDSAEYRKTGAVFWPDYGRFAKWRAVWAAAGIEYRDEPEFESGQMVIDKARCWRALNVAMHLNEHSDWWYRLIHGDKDTFHLAWRKIDQEYAMPSRGVARLRDTMCQHDFANRRLFQHRNLDKWRLHPRNAPVPGFRHERECFAFLDVLAACWQPATSGFRRWQPSGQCATLLAASAEIAASHFVYHRVGHDHRALSLLADGRVGVGAASCEAWWNLRETEAGLILDLAGIDGPTCHLRRRRDGVWRGRWLRFERMPIELTPQPASVGREPVGKGRKAVGGRRKKSEGSRQVASSILRLPPSAFSSHFPRLIHQIWLGSNPPPEQAKLFSDDWRRRHPGWHYQLWTDADAARLEMINREAFDLAEGPGLRGDILRYEILHRYGGLYCDFDFECLRPLDPLLEQVSEEAFGGFEWPTVSYRRSFSNALLGALPGASFFRHVLTALPESIRLHCAERAIHGAETVPRATGPAFLTRCAIACPGITIFPQPILYPHPHEIATAYARHHFWGSWRQKGEWQTAGGTS